MGVPGEEWGSDVGAVVRVQGERGAGCFPHQVAAAEIQERTNEQKTKPGCAHGHMHCRVAPENS